MCECHELIFSLNVCKQISVEWSLLEVEPVGRDVRLESVATHDKWRNMLDVVILLENAERLGMHV